MSNLWRSALLLGVAVMMGGATCQTPYPPFVVEPTDTDKCGAACENLQRLGCAEGDPLEDGTSCIDFCVNTQQSGHPLNPACVMGIQACSELNACLR